MYSTRSSYHNTMYSHEPAAGIFLKHYEYSSTLQYKYVTASWWNTVASTGSTLLHFHYFLFSIAEFLIPVTTDHHQWRKRRYSVRTALLVNFRHSEREEFYIIAHSAPSLRLT